MSAAVYLDDLSYPLARQEMKGLGIDLVDFASATPFQVKQSQILLCSTIPDPETLARFESLRCVSLSAHDPGERDVSCLLERDVKVLDIRGNVSPEEPSIHTLSLLLALLRNIPREIRALGSHEVPLDEKDPAIRRISELVLGVVGFGAIGSHLAQLAAPMFGAVVGFDIVPGLVPPRWAAGSLRTLLHDADVITLHVPTQRSPIVTDEELAGIGRGSYIVNTSRRSAVDDLAILAALEDGRLAGYATDVLSEAALPVARTLSDKRNIIVTPHCAYYSERSSEEYVIAQVASVREWLELCER